jgi:hypothetical protein
VQAEIADQVPRRGEAANVADHRHQRRRGGGVHARDRHQPADLGRAQRGLGDRPVDPGELLSEEVELAQAGVERLPLVLGQLQRLKPSAARLAEQVGQLGTAL